LRQDQLDNLSVTYGNQDICGKSTCDYYQVTANSQIISLAIDVESFRPVNASFEHNDAQVEFTYSYPNLEINPPQEVQVLEFPEDPNQLDTEILHAIYGDQTNSPTDKP
jgi:hypothetical protein